MSSLNVVVLGDNEFAKELGKLGSHSDIAIYNRKAGEDIFSFIAPLTFPEKLSSMLQAVKMAEAGMLVVKALTPEIGECIIALNEAGVDKGAIILENTVQEQIKPLIKGTLLERYSFCEKSYSSVMNELAKISVEEVTGSLIFAMDHFFSTKSAGLVAVGRVMRGKIKAYDKVTVLPIKKEVLVKSLQKQDENANEALFGDRVGVALKGVEENELARGYILTNAEQEFKVSNIVSGGLSVSRFFKYPLEPGQRLQISLGLQDETVILKNIEGKEKLGAGESARVELMTESGKNLVYEENEKFIISRPEVKGLRIVGSGRCG